MGKRHWVSILISGLYAPKGYFTIYDYNWIKVLFSVLEYTKDADNPKNIGLYCQNVINVKDEEPSFSDIGIYRPEE